jgi:MOSC domain-containing protein YiiM
VIVERIFISPERGATQVEREQVTVQSDKGIVGDRNFGKNAYPGQNLTLVEAEEIEHFCEKYAHPPDLSLTRRNLVTRGVRLNDLLNVEFSIGNVRLRGVDLCEPCRLLGDSLANEHIASAAVVKHWLRRGGLLVNILSNGEITRGASIETGT